jgi:siderophore synthetase component
MEQLQPLNHALQFERWRSVSRALLAKMLSEFMYEEIINPKPLETNYNLNLYFLPLHNNITYRFKAQTRLFDSYRVLPESIERQESEVWWPATDPLQFILDIHTTVGMSAATTAHLIREISNTLLADAHMHAAKENQESDLLALDFALLEGEMEGHPWITFNKGRIGFGYDDYLAYAPERKQPVNFFWVAVRRDRAEFNSVRDLAYDTLMQEELGELEIAKFQEMLAAQQVDPANYYFLPIHEWQWKNMIVPLFAEELASRAIIPLGSGSDVYLPQQSVRTFSNVSHSLKRHVKLPLNVLNTVVYRGLPKLQTVMAPRVTEWVKSIRDRDPFLQEECRLILLGELASLHYDHPYYAQLPGAPYQYKEMLGCIWRESILSKVEADEHPMTMAALAHGNGTDHPFISRLISRSGLSAEAWIERLFNVLLPPILHYLYRYGMIFAPHGQNAILVLKDHIPYRLALKDFVDDVEISRHPLPELASLPPELRRVLPSKTPEELCQLVLVDLCLCQFRYLSDLLEAHYSYSEFLFWFQMRQAILKYQSRFPELEARFELFNLLTPSLTKLCLNRNRLFTYGYADNSERPHTTAFGQVSNALHQVDAQMERETQRVLFN